ncbi:MAG: hypothetical protein KIS85_09465 [Anaerolineales bacterium]|nr:hypothetical protein [Anaerolineales bacterium]
MIFLLAGVVALGVAAWWERAEAARPAVLARLGLYAALAAWIWAEVGDRAFRGQETSLLGLFIFGLGMLALAEILEQWGGPLQSAAGIGVPLMALCFALGFDVLRPDEYAAMPSGILRIGVALVAWQAHRALVRSASKESGLRPGLLAHIITLAVLVYAGTYKMMDRGWAMPWAYMAAGGALLAAASQMWRGWGMVFGREPLPPWLQRLAFGAAVALMTASAVFVYREFL